MSQYIISDEAVQDLNDISDYFLSRNSLDAGERFLNAFNLKCKQLISFPNSGRSYSHLLPELRGLILQGFIILYRASVAEADTRIEILRIVHGRRDLASIFAEGDD